MTNGFCEPDFDLEPDGDEPPVYEGPMERSMPWISV